MNKRGQTYTYLIIIAVLVIGWLIINNLRIPYKHTELESTFNFMNYWTCENNFLNETHSFGSDLSPMSCYAYTGFQKHKLSCENGKVMVTCYTTIYNKFFNTK